MQIPFAKRTRSLATAVAFLLVVPNLQPALSQSSSLLGDPALRQPLTLREYSWSYEEPPDRRPLQKHDIITILVDYRADMMSEGEVDRKKKMNVDAVLADWILLKGLFHMIPDPQSAGDPRVGGKFDNKYKAEATYDTRATLKFKIACHVVDVRPNGNLIIEGHHSIRSNNEVWDCSLTGEVRAKDVNLDTNTVLSENVAALRIDRREAGHVRDGYRRGWFLRFLDRIQPF